MASHIIEGEEEEEEEELQAEAPEVVTNEKDAGVVKLETVKESSPNPPAISHAGSFGHIVEGEEDEEDEEEKEREHDTSESPLSTTPPSATVLSRTPPKAEIVFTDSSRASDTAQDSSESQSSQTSDTVPEDGDPFSSFAKRRRARSRSSLTSRSATATAPPRTKSEEKLAKRNGAIRRTISNKLAHVYQAITKDLTQADLHLSSTLVLAQDIGHHIRIVNDNLELLTGRFALLSDLCNPILGKYGVTTMDKPSATATAVKTT